MIKYQHIWNKWSEALHRWGLHEAAAVVLEAAEPLNYLGAQLVYFGLPALNAIFPEEQISALADLLECPESTKSFTLLLRFPENESHRSS